VARPLQALAHEYGHEPAPVAGAGVLIRSGIALGRGRGSRRGDHVGTRRLARHHRLGVTRPERRRLDAAEDDADVFDPPLGTGDHDGRRDEREVARAYREFRERRARAGGLLWYDEGGTVRTLPALAVPAARVRDTSGAGDVFHGAYVYSYLDNPFKGWEQHFRFGQHAATYKIQHLGNEAGLPTLDAIDEVAREFDQDAGVEPRPARENIAAMRANR